MEEMEIQNFKELENKWLQWCDHIKIIDRTRILRRVLELKYESKKHTGLPITRLFSKVLKDIKEGVLYIFSIEPV